MSKRTEKVGDLIQQTLAQALHREISDPRLKLLSITGVEVTGDLAHATVYISMLGDDTKLQDALKALDKAKGFLRRYIAKECQLRATPELHFKHDTSGLYSEKMSELIKQAREKDSDK